jgi:hypothetical protein
MKRRAQKLAPEPTCLFSRPLRMPKSASGGMAACAPSPGSTFMSAAPLAQEAFVPE